MSLRDAEAAEVVCPYGNCGNWNVEHVEDYPTVAEFLCRGCKRYFSKTIPSPSVRSGDKL